MRIQVSKARLFELYKENRSNMQRTASEALALVRFYLIRRSRI